MTISFRVVSIMICLYFLFSICLKSKGLPQQAEVAQGVPGRLRPRIFLTFQHYNGGRSSAKGTGRLYPRRNPCYSLSEAESTSGHMVLSGESRKKSPVTPQGIDPGTVRLVAQCLNSFLSIVYNSIPYFYILLLSLYFLSLPSPFYVFISHLHMPLLQPCLVNF